jgi:pyruvate-ferredoxin/flavodoxin oxidoreductase
MYQENRFKMLTKIKPTEAKQLLKEAQEDVNHRWQMYQYLANRTLNIPDPS